MLLFTDWLDRVRAEVAYFFLHDAIHNVELAVDRRVAALSDKIAQSYAYQVLEATQRQRQDSEVIAQLTQRVKAEERVATALEDIAKELAPRFVFYLNGESCLAVKRVVAVEELLEAAAVDPMTSMLVEKRGVTEQVHFKLMEWIELKPGMQFFTAPWKEEPPQP